MRRKLGRTQLICAFAALVSSLSAAACATAPEGASWDRSTEEQMIYAAILDSTIAPTRAEQIYVADQIMPDLTREKTVPEFWRDLYAIPDIDRGTVVDFERSNLFPRKIPGVAATRVRVTVAEDSVLQRLSPATALVTFSRPGISPNHQQALVMLRVSGSLPHATYHALLEKVAGRWRMKHLITVSAT